MGARPAQLSTRLKWRERGRQLRSIIARDMQRIAEWSPMNWGLEGLLSVLLRGGDIAAALPHVLRLGGFAVLMFGIAAFLFGRAQR